MSIKTQSIVKSFGGTQETSYDVVCVHLKAPYGNGHLIAAKVKSKLTFQESSALLEVVDKQVISFEKAFSMTHLYRLFNSKLST